MATNVLKRLRASLDRSMKEQREDGIGAGKDWARERAEADELMRLEDFHESEGFGELVEHSCEHHAPGGRLADIITGDDELGNDGRREFWQNALLENADRIFDVAFAEGFIDGAMEIWDSVKDKL